MATRTITLSDHPPVTISDDTWPLIAKGVWVHECGQYAQNGSASVALRVRRHADGRALVYVTSSSACQCDLPEQRGGRIVGAQEDICAAIREVALEVCDSGADTDREDEVAREIARDAIADLPAVTLE